MADVKLVVTAEIANAISKIKDLTDQSVKSLKTVEKQTSKASQFISNFAANIAAAGLTKAISVATGAVSGFFDTFIVDGVRAQSVTEDAQNQIRIALEATGIATKETIDRFNELGDAIEKNSKFSGDAVLQAAAEIQQLGGLTSESLDQATRASVDLAAALGFDLSTAATLVGKAAAGNAEAFKRYGIEIKKGKDDAETFANVLATLNERFGGAAAKQVNTFSGALTQATVAFEDIQKAIGSIITQSPALTGFVKGVTQVFKGISGAITGAFEGKDPFQEILLSAIQFARFINTYLIPPILELGRVALSVVGLIGGAFLGLAGKIVEFVGAVAVGLDRLGLAPKGLVNGLAEATNAIAALQQTANRTALEALKSIGNQAAVSAVNDALDTIESSVRRSAAQIKSDVEDATTSTKQKIIELSDEAKKRAIELAIRFGDPEETRAKLAEQYQIINDAQNAQLISDLQAQEIRTSLEVEAEQKRLDAILNARRTAQAAQYDDLLTQLELERQVLDESLKQQELTDAQRAASAKRLAQVERKISEQKLQYAASFFGDLASLTQTGNKDLFAIGKAAALAEAVVSGALAIQKALASAPPPINFALAAAVGVRTAVNVATISAQQLSTGISSVPSGFPNDSFPALLTSGERVISAPQNKDLTAFIEQETEGDKESQGTMIELLGVIADRVSNLESTIIVNIGNREIMREVRDGIRSGQVLAT